MGYVVLVLIIVVVLVVAATVCVRRITLLEFERGLKYTRGKFARLLPPGQYWYIPFFSRITKVDVRHRYVSITGQEVLSSDGVALKVSLAANYRVSQPDIAINMVEDYEQALYLELQLALRQIIGSLKMDTILEARSELSKRLQESTKERAGQLGLELISVDLKDMMFPGQLKQIFTQTVKARQEALAALERARGETAALRSLANAAKMFEKNPHLMQLRLIQSLGESSGNTLVLGMPGESTVIPMKSKNAQGPKATTGQQPADA